MQVPLISILFMTLSALIALALPIGLFLVFHKTYHAQGVPLLFGIAGFILFALVLERSIHILVLRHWALKERPLVYILYAVLMAGVFEETARFMAFTFLKRSYAGIGTGLAYGAGHGGIEAVAVAGVSMVNALVTSIMINTGNIETITGTLQGPALEQAHQHIAALVTSAPPLFLVSGIERVSALGIHLALSVIVFYAVYGSHKKGLFPLAILIHALINLPAAAMQAGLLKNMVLVEGLISLGAIAVIMIAKRIHENVREHGCAHIREGNNPEKNNREKGFNKKIAPVIVALCLIGFYTLYAIAFIILNIPMVIKIIALIVSILITAVVITVLIERIKEIDGGEEDDLGNY